jgi:hypothetical protein
LHRREEASGIPNLLVAPKVEAGKDTQAAYEGIIGDHEGYYEDGAYYTAKFVPTSSYYSDEDYLDEDEEEGRDPQTAYFNSILERFETLRAKLQQTPPPDALTKLGRNHPTQITKLKKNGSNARWWRYYMDTTNPEAAQVASMDKFTVLRILEYLAGGQLFKSGYDISMSVSLWVWALLARLPERGELSSEEIAAVRELGKKAVLVGIGLKGENSWEEGLREVEAGLDDEEEDENSLIVNEEEIELELEEDFNFEDDPERKSGPGSFEKTTMAQPIGPQLPLGSNGLLEDSHESYQDCHPTVAVEMSKGDGLAADGIADETSSEPGLRGGHATSEDLEEGQIDPEDLPETSKDAEFAAAKARVLSNLRQETVVGAFNQEPEVEVPQDSARLNTKATVDMILTVAGEMYGQRDLLEFRSTWLK